MVSSPGNLLSPDKVGFSGDRLDKTEKHDGKDKIQACEEQGMGFQQQQQHSLAKQPSILSLTLEEIQSTVCEPGKSFGSMNMNEFLTNIWTAEETNPLAGPSTGTGGSGANRTAADNPVVNRSTGPAPLGRQGSLSIPASLSRKTVDEVWSEIHQGQQQQQGPQHSLPQQYEDSWGAAPRQPTFGEMTLEDFLIKAGVVGEGGVYGGPCPSAPATHPQANLQQKAPPNYSNMGMAYGEPQSAVAAGDGVYQRDSFQQDESGCGTKSGNGAGGYCGVGSPVSSVSSDGLGGSQVDNLAGLWEADVGGGANAGGRKRALNWPVERVVERRQRRMIKNRESAARSRARKQAYTVELEAELNFLKEENARLHEEQRQLVAKRRQMLLDSLVDRARSKSGKATITLRRCTSSVW